MRCNSAIMIPFFPDRISLTILYHFSHKLWQNALQKVLKSFGIIISRLKMFGNNILWKFRLRNLFFIWWFINWFLCFLKCCVRYVFLDLSWFTLESFKLSFAYICNQQPELTSNTNMQFLHLGFISDVTFTINMKLG